MIYNDDLLKQLNKAKQDSEYEDRIIEKYLPFIKSEATKLSSKLNFLENDDAYSLSMFAFHNAIITYNEDKGAFFPYASRLIHNQLLDYARRESRHSNQLSLNSVTENDEDDKALIDIIPDKNNAIQELTDVQAAKSEIIHFSGSLKEFSLSLSDIADSCPKQNRTLNACIKVLETAKNNPNLIDKLLKNKRLPISELAKESDTEIKTIERHRNYIIALMLAYTNGFEIIRGHLREMSSNKNGGLR